MSVYSKKRFDVEIIKSNGEAASPFNRHGYAYIPLENREKYKIRLLNNGETRCDAIVKLEGEVIGIWRIPPYSEITIERPAYKDKAFIFIGENTPEARRAGVIPGSETNGLVEVEFKPEIHIAYVSKPTMITYSREMSPLFSRSSFGSGSTVLGEKTGQSFGSTSPITMYDYENIQTIIIRLVLNKKEEGQYETIRKSKIPPRIEKNEFY